ncbi:RidA family protein [Sinorhizobium meliloti]
MAVNGQLLVSGQLPIDPVTGAFISADPVEQALG